MTSGALPAEGHGPEGNGRVVQGAPQYGERGLAVTTKWVAGSRSRTQDGPAHWGRRWTKEQESEAQRLVRDKTPDQLKMPCALWDR